MRVLELFAGAGGGLMGSLILGHEPVCAVEWEPYCCDILRERVEDGWFPGMYVYQGDVRLFHASDWKGRVDSIHAGWPCTDISVAGKQAGIGDGTRSGLYREVIRCIREIRPREVFMENVAAVLSLRQKITLIIIERVRQFGFFGEKNNQSLAGRYVRRIVEATEQAAIGYVLGDLVSCGYGDIRWICVKASDVGANHHRDRWWLLARRKDVGERDQRGREACAAESRTGMEPEPKRCGENVSNSIGQRQQGQGQHVNASDKEENRDGQASDAINERERGEREAKRGICRVDDGMASITHGTEKPGWYDIEPNVGRTTNDQPNRAARLKALGNGQHPLQMAVAYKMLEALF